MAVINQQESVLNLLYETAAIKEIIIAYVDDSKQNILHLARKLARPSRLNIVIGAALQMQWELLWFKVSVYIISMRLNYIRMGYKIYVLHHVLIEFNLYFNIYFLLHLPIHLENHRCREDCASISEHGE